MLDIAQSWAASRAVVDGEWTSIYEHRILSTLSRSQMTIEGLIGPDRSQHLRNQSVIWSMSSAIRCIRTARGPCSRRNGCSPYREGAVESGVSLIYDVRAWPRPVHVSNYAEDLEDFPRADEFIPVWGFCGRLHEAGI